MRLASIDGPAGILWDGPTTRIRLLDLAPGATIAAESGGETVLCLVRGAAEVTLAEAPALALAPPAGLHLPAAAEARITAGPDGARLLEVLSRHPALDPARRLMPALDAADPFSLAEDRRFRYSDHIRGGVIAFPPGEGAEKHWHEGAEELFWFQGGTGLLVTPDGEHLCRPGDITILAAREWHVLDNLEPEAPLRLFFTVSPNLVPSHTYFDALGRPFARSMDPLTRA